LFVDFIRRIAEFIVNAQVAGFNEQEVNELKKMMLFWELIVASFKEENITFNNTDYKNYLIISLAIIQANNLQSQHIVKDITGGMEKEFSVLGKSIDLLIKLIQP
jgi:hypothetical protein